MYNYTPTQLYTGTLKKGATREGGTVTSTLICLDALAIPLVSENIWIENLIRP